MPAFQQVCSVHCRWNSADVKPLLVEHVLQLEQRGLVLVPSCCPRISSSAQPDEHDMDVVFIVRSLFKCHALGQDHDKSLALKNWHHPGGAAKLVSVDRRFVSNSSQEST